MGASSKFASHLSANRSEYYLSGVLYTLSDAPNYEVSVQSRSLADVNNLGRKGAAGVLTRCLTRHVVASTMTASLDPLHATQMARPSTVGCAQVGEHDAEPAVRWS